MAEDNNRKSIREANQKAKNILKAENVEIEKEIVTETKDEEGNISTKTETVTTTFKAGAGAYTDLFNAIADEVNRKAQKEMAKPRYRFLENRKRYFVCDKSDRKRAVLVDQKSLEPVLFDEDRNIILENGVTFEDIVDRRYRTSAEKYKSVDFSKDLDELLGIYDSLVVVKKEYIHPLSQDERDSIISKLQNKEVIKKVILGYKADGETYESVYFDEEKGDLADKDYDEVMVVEKSAMVHVHLQDKKNGLVKMKNSASFEDAVFLVYSNERYEHVYIIKDDESTDKESFELVLKDRENLAMEYVRMTDHHNVYAQIDEIKKKLNNYRYCVEICEDLDCTDVTKDSRYCVRIRKGNSIHVDFDLLKYEDDIKDFAFDEVGFIENMIGRIEGSNSTKTKNIATCIADYLAYIIYFREFYTLQYSKIGWEYYDWDRSGWIFKYDKIYSKIGMMNGEARDNCAEGLECQKELLDIEEFLSDINRRDLCTGVEDGEEPDLKLSDDEESERDLVYYADEFEWIAFTRRLLETHPYDALILGAGISGLVRPLLPYTKENNININIVGAPASGKSTICHYLLGMFGNPEKLEGSFSDTANSMEQIRIQRPVLPYVLDERMLRIEGESEKTKQHTILMDIFREYEGKVKERLGKQYEETSGERTYGPIISSSVKSMMDYVFKTDDLGQYRRFMEFNIGNAKDANLFKDDKEAKRAEHIAYKNYGYGVRIIVDYLLNLMDGCDEKVNAISDRFNELDAELEAMLSKREEKENDEKVKGLTSSSKRFALIVLSYQILRDALDDYNEQMWEVYNEDKNMYGIEDIAFDMSIKKSDIIDQTVEVENLLIDNLVLKMKKVNDKAEAIIQNNLYDYILNNNKYFYEIKKGEKPKDGAEKVIDEPNRYIGFITKTPDNLITVYTVRNYELGQFWRMANIPKPEDIIAHIQELNKSGVTPSTNKRVSGIDGSRTDYPIPSLNGERVPFSYRKIRYVRPVDAEEKAGDSK